MFLIMWALDNLPPEFRERIRLNYVEIRRQKAVDREDETDPQIEALSHHTPLNL